MNPRPPRSNLFPYTTLFRSVRFGAWAGFALSKARFPLRKFWLALFFIGMILPVQSYLIPLTGLLEMLGVHDSLWALILPYRSDEQTPELQSQSKFACRLLLA